MAAYVKYEVFVEDLCNETHDLFGVDDTLKIALTNAAPNVGAHVVLGDITEIAAGNGYTAGGEDTQNSGARAAGVFTLTGTKVVWTATGAVPTFQYVVLYNVDVGPPVAPLIAYWNHGSGVTLANGETFTVKFDNGDPTGDIFTLE